jgi:predicted HTH transcriptional regulator
VDTSLFNTLPHEDESNTLDFKRDQYAFANAPDDDSAEFVKDIVGFANAWRCSNAYILIGVEHVRGERSNVIGVAEHLPEHSLLESYVWTHQE